MELSSKEGRYFSAMNTADGFCSYFGDIFGSAKNLFIIKGGPGTGKSRLMKDFAAKARAKGHTVEEFYCSSDVNSLDGVIAKELGCAFIDGTAPHIYDPVTPGAKDNIINLGQFWDSSFLLGKRSEIEEMNKQKAKLYESVYLYLSVIKCYDDIIKGMLMNALMQEKFNSFIERFAFSLGHGVAFSKSVRIRSAVSSSGFVVFDTYAKMAKNRFAVIDFCGVAAFLMKTLLKIAEMRNLAITVSYNPFDKTAPDAIYFHDSSTSVYIGCKGDSSEKTINMRRFIDDNKLKPHKSKIRANSKLRQGSYERLFLDFAEIKRIHDEVEGIYSMAMNFVSKEDYCNQLIESILDFE